MKHLGKKAKAMVLCLVMAVSMASCADKGANETDANETCANETIDISVERRYKEDREWCFGSLERFLRDADSIGYYADSIIEAMQLVNLNEHYYFERAVKDRIRAFLRLDSIVEANNVYAYVPDSVVMEYEKTVAEYSGAELSLLALVYRDFMYNRFLWEKYNEIEKMKSDTVVFLR